MAHVSKGGCSNIFRGCTDIIYFSNSLLEIDLLKGISTLGPWGSFAICRIPTLPGIYFELVWAVLSLIASIMCGIESIWIGYKAIDFYTISKNMSLRSVSLFYILGSVALSISLIILKWHYDVIYTSEIPVIKVYSGTSMTPSSVCKRGYSGYWTTL